jgi:putative transposase
MYSPITRLERGRLLIGLINRTISGNCGLLQHCPIPGESMPRTSRASAAGYSYHVVNRGNARGQVFHKPEDYDAFISMMAEACVRIPMRILAYCLMPNHFHMALWPIEDGDLSRWMHWLLTKHVARYLRHYHSSGHVWQGRFKSFPIEQDVHLLAVLRYIERNPLRAGLVERAEAWRWSSLPWLASPERSPLRLEPGTVLRGREWVEGVNAAMTDAELERIRECVRRDRPFGSAAWTTVTAQVLGLEYSLRPRGRPRAAVSAEARQ